MLFRMPLNMGRRAMPRLCFIHALCLVALTSGSSLTYAGEKLLTLSEALSRAMTTNPGLQVFDLRLDGLEGRRLSVDNRPALEADLAVDNILGSGNLQGFDGAEYTLSLSSTLELGDKRQARIRVVDSGYGLLEAERRAETLDVLGRVTQRFITTLALQEKLELASEAVSLAETMHGITSRRAHQGAAPQADVLRARAVLTQSRIAQSRLHTEFENRKVALTSLWGDIRPDFQRLEGDLFQPGPSDSFEALYQRVIDSPAIQIYANEQRIREAEIQLTRSQSESDIRWQAGIRRFEEADDTALVAGISVPLFAGRRNRGDVQRALAARDEVAYRREASLLRLHARLFAAYHLRQQSIETVEQIRGQLLPDLNEALTHTQEAYERGRYSYAEWAAAQQELLAARQALIDAATTALLNQALIEQLTAQPLATVQGASAR